MPSNPSNKEEKIVEFIDPQAIAEKFDFYTKVILAVLVVAFITLLIMVSTLVIDSLHINSATYREYSEKMQSIESMRESNNLLLQQNKDNQDKILKQQAQILQILKK